MISDSVLKANKTKATGIKVCNNLDSMIPSVLKPFSIFKSQSDMLAKQKANALEQVEKHVNHRGSSGRKI